MTRKEHKLLLLLIFLVSFIFFYRVLGTYFSGDDFFHFQVSKTDGSLMGFLKLFGFYPFSERGIAFYRPLFREALYNLFYSIFGLNSLSFRILQFVLHFVNITLVYTLSKKLLKKVDISFIASLIYAINPAHVATFYYLAGGIQAMGATMFLLATLILFGKFLETKKRKYKLFSTLFFLAGLSSHELSVLILPLMIGEVFLKEKKLLAGIVRSIKELYFHVFIFFIFLYLNINVVGFPKGEVEYNVVLNIGILINSLGWYTGWALGLPEMLVDFVNPGFRLNPNLMRYFGSYFGIIFPAFFISTGILIFNSIYLLNIKNKILRNINYWYFLIWFPLGLLPVIFLPLHKSTYYLSLSLPAVSILISGLALEMKKRWNMLFWILTLSLITLFFASVKLGDKTYWAANRGKIAKKIISDFKVEYPELPKGAVIYFKNDSRYPFISSEWGGTSTQAKTALSGSDALRVVYNDESISVYYEDTGNLPKNLTEEEIFSVTAYLQ